MFKSITFIIIATLLVGCGSRIDSMARTIDYAIFGEDDVNLTAEEIQSLAYPYQYLTVGEQSRIALALGFDDNGIYKWLSGNQEVLTTFNGRVINTQGLTDGLVYVANLNNDPLRCLLTQRDSCVGEWTTTVQFGLNQDARLVNLTSSFARVETSQIQLPAGNTLQVEHWQETVTGKDHQWVNHFWISSDNRRVVKSMQKWGHQRAEFALQELKAYGKELAASGAISE